MSKKLKKGDKVIVITGKDKGKIGEIVKICKDSKAIVSGINLATVHKKPTMQSPGERIKIEKPIDISNVSFCEDDKPVKIGFKIEDGKKVRFSKKTKKNVG